MEDILFDMANPSCNWSQHWTNQSNVPDRSIENHVRDILMHSIRAHIALRNEFGRLRYHCACHLSSAPNSNLKFKIQISEFKLKFGTVLRLLGSAWSPTLAPHQDCRIKALIVTYILKPYSRRVSDCQLPWHCAELRNNCPWSQSGP